MKTSFSPAQLADPDVRESEKILRSCVHCGFCTATCPTYVLLGDELDSPRGRIYLIKSMLEEGRPADEKTVKHIDRCLSCLSCMTTCPSDVHYMHLVDHARKHIEDTYRRPALDRYLRQLLAMVLPYPAIFRIALLNAAMARPLAPLFRGRWRAMLELAPKGGPKPPSPVDRPQTHPAQGQRRGRVALLAGCAQQVLAPEINEATIRLLTRHGIEVVIAKGAGCCGALTHHMGKEKEAHRSVKANIDAWLAEHARDPLDAIIINASGCGTTVKDYGFMLREDKAYAEKARTVAALTRDITEHLATLDLGRTGAPAPASTDLAVTYHSACSMQHGQKLTTQPKALLTAAGFKVEEPKEGHLCCGSAGIYNIVQPEISKQLKARKVKNLERTRPDVIATGNIGCITQLRTGTDVPVCHTVELLDWATGGPKPAALG
jgi:glycolate oxidase iron-sulfur subunit